MNLESERAALMQTSRDWARTAASGDLERTLSFWSDDAIVMPPGQPAVVGKAAIREFLRQTTAIPGFSITWEPEQATVANDGDVGFMVERNRITSAEANGAVREQFGKGVTVWRKDSTGGWKCVVDTWNENPTERAGVMDVSEAIASSFEYRESGAQWNDDLIFAAIRHQLPATGGRLLDAGCGNGSMSARFAALGFVVTGIDASTTGIATARRAHPDIAFEQADLTCPLTPRPPFDVAVCVEVIEHVYDPEAVVRNLVRHVVPGGRVILTTPYYGYLKVLAIVLLGRWRRHVDPLWLGGHIKLFTVRDLRELCRRAGLTDVRVQGVGRAPWLWKSALVTARRCQ